jgi:hypothetical protein
MKIVWNEAEVQGFTTLKQRMCETLELWQIDMDQPFRLCTDASDYAIGAELQQKILDQWKPVALFSRKLTSSQLNWSVREKETYAIVAALRKWAGVIGFQPLEVTTDHRAIIDWVTEHVDTPSGPRGRRARWHETFSQFDVTINYVPGPENTVADGMSRFAYPANSARDDVSIHGSLEARDEVKRMEEQERKEAKETQVALIWKRGLPVQILGVKTRGGAKTQDEEDPPDESESEEEEEEESSSEEEEETRPPRPNTRSQTRASTPIPSEISKKGPTFREPPEPKDKKTQEQARFEWTTSKGKTPEKTPQGAPETFPPDFGEEPPADYGDQDLATSSTDAVPPPLPIATPKPRPEAIRDRPANDLPGFVWAPRPPWASSGENVGPLQRNPGKGQKAKIRQVNIPHHGKNRP